MSFKVGDTVMLNEDSEQVQLHRVAARRHGVVGRWPRAGESLEVIFMDWSLPQVFVKVQNSEGLETTWPAYSLLPWEPAASGSPCTCTHSFLMAGCLCGAVQPYEVPR